MTTPASHLWRPSNARYVQVDGFVPTPRGPQIPPPKALAWPANDPGDTLDYVFDISPALTANPGDTISTLDITVSPNNPGDVTLVSSSADGPRAVLWLTGGQALTTYTVTVSITTTGGRTLAQRGATGYCACLRAGAGQRTDDICWSGPDRPNWYPPYNCFEVFAA